MIKKFIDRLLGKPSAVLAPSVPAGKRVEVAKDEHGIDPTLVDERALKVVSTLADAGFEAYIVGGAVRDLLLGLRPKDFDVATNATPEQVKGLFRRAFIIGRRFRIVHVVFGRGRQDRGLSEVVEVSTFRAYFDAAAAEQIEGNEKTTATDMTGKTHVVDASGRVLRDNVWGPQIEDAARRDFTINALYYDPRREVVVDYHGGIKDAKKKLLRMIGDPSTRYREDPVRIIRVVRFAAKLGFEIEAKTRVPIKTMVDLLDNVPPSRTFDEMIKLLQTGHALASIEELRKQGLHRGVFPVLDVALDEAHRHDGREKFVQLALADTDRRVSEGKAVAPSFMLACMLWHDVLDRWQKLRGQGEPPFPALQQAIDAAFDARIGDISGRGKLAADMRDVWMMQPRFERRVGNSPYTLTAQPRFRAGLDFMRLRAEAGEIDAELPVWWEAFSTAGSVLQQDMLSQAKETDHARRAAEKSQAHDAPRAAAKSGVAADASRPTPARKAASPARFPASEAPCRARRSACLSAWAETSARRRATLESAARALATLPHTELRRCSSRYRSAPVDASGPDFDNAVAELETTLAAHDLWARLLQIEQQHGRERSYRNAPRTLDLDLLLYGDACIATPALIVPHPRLHERAFVLAPLAELWPECVVPGKGAVKELLSRVAHQRIERIP